MNAMQHRRAIGTVTYLGGLPALLEPFCWSWAQMIAYCWEFMTTPDTYIATYRAKVSDHAVARNAIVEHMQGDWVVMLDTDHEFDPDIVARLLNAANEYGLDVLTGLYRMKAPPHYPVVYEWLPNEGEGEHLQQITGWTCGPGFLEVGSAGGGCLFVRRVVFDRIRAELDEAPFDRIHPYSEDHSFFLRLRRLGITPFVATHIQANHLRIVPVTNADAPRFVTQPAEVEVDGYKMGGE